MTFLELARKEAPMLPSSHHGSWRGPNRLWLEDPARPERSDGALEASESTLAYTWSFRGKQHEGRIELTGQPQAIQAVWSDSWHAKDGMALHGSGAHGTIALYGTYSSGDGVDWGWQIELDVRDPEHLTLRMFNVPPDGEPQLSVDLRGARSLL